MTLLGLLTYDGVHQNYNSMKPVIIKFHKEFTSNQFECHLTPQAAISLAGLLLSHAAEHLETVKEDY